MFNKFNAFFAVLLVALVAAGNSFAAAVLDLSDVTTKVSEEVGGAAPVIAAVIGIVVAVGLVIKLVKRA